MWKFAIKGALAGTAVYFISEQGVWKDSGTTANLSKTIRTSAAPYVTVVKKQLPFELPDVPPRTEISYMFKYYWNKGVLATFSFIANLPMYVRDVSRKGISAVMDSTEVKNLFISSADTADEKTK